MQRGLSIQEAAEYCGITTECFRTWVRDGLIPGPWPGTKRYDRKALDNALDKLSGIPHNASTTAYEAWKAKRNAHSAQAY
ncbi:MAG: helix-turn-helix domain-containing protein [Pseudomonadota bacterium]